MMCRFELMEIIMKKFRESGIGCWLREDLDGATDCLLRFSTEFVAENFEYQDSSDFLYMLICAENRLAEQGDYRAALVYRKKEELAALLRAKNGTNDVDWEIPF